MHHMDAPGTPSSPQNELHVHMQTLDLGLYLEKYLGASLSLG